MSRSFKTIALMTADTPLAHRAARELAQKYTVVDSADADVIVALGGDGHMLEVMHATMKSGTPIYGLNLGSVGFLLNNYSPDFLMERMNKAEEVTINPLLMKAVTVEGDIIRAHAINEVSLWRSSRQAAKIAIECDGVSRLSELICDGVMVATPTGSTAYNLSAHGPILPIGSDVLALTPVCPFRPRRWRGALLPHNTAIRFTVLEPEKRPVNAAADAREAVDIRHVDICEDRHVSIKLLFDPGQSLEDRIIKEQFIS